MYKVGQRVKVTSIESTRWQNFNHLDKERILNKIFKIVDDLGTSGEEHAWRLETPFGVYNFVEFQFRALKKKGSIKEAKIPKITLKEEVTWLNKVQGNFKNAGKIQSDLDDTLNSYGHINRLRDIFAVTPTLPRRTGSMGIPIPVPVVPEVAERIYVGEETTVEEDDLMFGDNDLDLDNEPDGN